MRHRDPTGKLTLKRFAEPVEQSVEMAARRDTRRRFEQFVRNPDCEANVVSAVAGVDMAKVAQAESGEQTMGQSPFALARGTVFEAALFRDNAKRMRAALLEAGVLEKPATGFLDLRLRQNGGPIRDLDTAVGRTVRLLEDLASAKDRDRRKLPALITGAALRVPGQPIMLPDGVVALDALAVTWGEDASDCSLQIGEVKTYPDRAGYTDKGDLASARAQAGVYRYALQLVLEEMGANDAITCKGTGFLVLSRSGSNEPSVRAGEDLEFLTARAKRGFDRLRAAADRLTPFDPSDEAKGIKTVRDSAISYSQTCIQFCDRAALCRQLAATENQGVLLGDDVKRFLGRTSPKRAIELLHGKPPRGAAEADLARRLRDAGSGP